ncbi:MAG: flagellar assembly protein FliW [Leptospirales bacterium]
MKEFETTRFGRIPLDPERILTFPEGLLGFQNVSRYYLLETSEPSVFFWLQAVDDPGLAFVVMDSEDLMPGYRDKVRTILPDPMFREQEMSSMVIVTIPGSDPEKMTANLQGPLLIRSSDRIGRQVALFDEEGWLRYPLFGAPSGS